VLLPRIGTAIVGVPALLFLIHWGGLSFALLTGAVAALCLYEYGVILLLGGRQVGRLMSVLGGTVLAVGLALGGPLGLLLACVVGAVVLRELFAAEHSLDRMALTLFGAVFIGWMPSHLALIRDLRPFGEKLTYMLFVSVWVCDTAAYFAGRFFGKHKLAPVVSPKKTWEGFVAGLLGSALVITIFRLLNPGMLSQIQTALAVVAVGVLGQLSDLAESLVKRAVGAKDSGALLPGHGGVMDRFDSYILAAPALYYCLTLPV
jgi:phosphatidate cytidylyltransferase